MRTQAYALVLLALTGCDLLGLPDPSDLPDAKDLEALQKDPLTVGRDMIYEQLECQEVARPSTLRRIRDLLEHPSPETATALATNPQDLATLVSLAGPETEATVVVLRNILAVAPGVPDLVTGGWAGVQERFECGDDLTLQCTAGEESVTVSCDEQDRPAHIELAFDGCTVKGKVIDGSVSLAREGTDANLAHASFDSLAIDESKVIEGDVLMRFGPTAGDYGEMSASVTNVRGLRLIEHGGPEGGLECGKELGVDVLDLSTGDAGARIELAGAHRTEDNTFAVETYGEHLKFDGSCACPRPGSAISLEVPEPLGVEGATAHAKIRWGAPDRGTCASVIVDFTGWPTGCGPGLDDCAGGATAATLEQILGAFCLDP